MQRTLQEEPATLFFVGSYHIGKERAYLGAAQALGIKVKSRVVLQICICVLLARL